MTATRAVLVKRGGGAAASAVDASTADGAADGTDPVLAAWQKQYPMPAETAPGALPDVKGLYRPPRNDAKGLAIAAAVIGLWAVAFWHAMWGVRLGGPEAHARGVGVPLSPWWDVAATFCAVEFLSAGLFITAHDAMHGAVCFRSRRANDAVGRVAAALYAWFDFGLLHRKHWEHHGATGVVGEDPDFHGGRAALVPWFLRFMAGYATLGQAARIFAWTVALQAAGVPYRNLVVYLAGAPLVAALRLFYFGTYLPHLPPSDGAAMPWHLSHSTDVGPVWAFLRCWMFEYHWEHHRFPYAPWWELPKLKRLTRRLRAEGRFVPPPPGVQRLLL